MQARVHGKFLLPIARTVGKKDEQVYYYGNKTYKLAVMSSFIES